MILMCGLVILCRGIGKTGLPKSIHPCTSLNPYPKQKWVSWHLHSLTVQLSVVRPAIFLCNAQQSGKAGRKSHVKASANLEHQVQQVLQNYLHYTRSLPFADAEHISLYAPCFLQKLVSRVNAQEHISKALERYLLYNPINEFEPFFESIGVKTSEIHRFLPPGKMYLNEEEFLLANASTLKNSGFPRHVLVKLYKEHPELFSCSTAKLQKKLQFYEKLGVSKFSLIRILTCCPSLLNDDVQRKFETVANGLNEFQVERNRICCLLEKNPLKCSSILEKLMLLAGIGCPWDEISMLYRTKSQLFINSSEKALYSIVDFLSNLGLRKENIGSIILHYPEVLKWDPSKFMAVNLDLARVGLDEKEMIGMTLCHPNLQADDLIKLMEDVNCIGLEKQGVAACIRENLKRTMRTLLSEVSSEKFQNIPSGESELVHRRDDLIAHGSKREHLKSTMPQTPLPEISSQKFQNTHSRGSELVHRRDDPILSGVKLNHASGTQEINISENLQDPIQRHKLNILLKLGLLNYPELMIKVARKIHCGSNKLQERLSHLLRLGLPFNVVCQMVMSQPRILNQSADSIQKKIDFLCSTTFNPWQALTSFPQYFSYHLEGRIKPRYKMYAWLKTNDLLKQECSFNSIFALPEGRFIQKYVKCHPEGIKYSSLSELGQVMSMTLLSKVSSEKIQNILSGESELFHRRDDLIDHGAKLKHASGTEEIKISENLQEPIQRHKLNFLLKLGLLNYPEQMIKVDRDICCESNKMQERLSCLLRLRLPFNVVCDMVRSRPRILNQSADLIQKKFDFLCSTTFNPLQALTSFPHYFSYHLEARIKPRYNMYAWLKTNNLLKKECVLSSIILVPERIFVQKYVNCHPEGSKYFSLCKLGQV